MGRRLGKVENCEEWKRQGKQRMKKEVVGEPRARAWGGSEIKASR